MGSDPTVRRVMEELEDDPLLKRMFKAAMRGRSRGHGRLTSDRQVHADLMPRIERRLVR